MINMKYKFNHKQIMKLAEGVLVYGLLTLILSSIAVLVIHMIQNPHVVSNATFGIYG